MLQGTTCLLAQQNNNFNQGNFNNPSLNQQISLDQRNQFSQNQGFQQQNQGFQQQSQGFQQQNQGFQQQSQGFQQQQTQGGVG